MGEQKIVLYFAPWCGACQRASAYLHQRGVPFEQKDVGEVSTRVELLYKLKRAQVRKKVIPVIDVAGTIIVGFTRATKATLDDVLAGAGVAELAPLHAAGGGG